MLETTANIRENAILLSCGRLSRASFTIVLILHNVQHNALE
nr:MAG TPA: hypothetical protein [Crassvirales sp.]